MGCLLKFCYLTWREKHFFCEAGILLLLSNLAVKTIAFRHIDKFLRARWRDKIETPTDSAEGIRLVNRSILHMANSLPWQSQCLSRSIAQFIMLRRRGIRAVLVTGVKFSERSLLQAHAWIQTSDLNGLNSDNPAFTIVIRIGDKPFVAGSLSSPP